MQTIVMTWSIRAAAPSEAAKLANFAARLFRQAYEITHPEPTLSEYLADSFATPRFAQTIEDPASTILVVVSSNGSWIGYAELHQGAPTAPTTVLTRSLPGTVPIEIVRFYVDREWHGQGVAQALMRGCDEWARASAGDALWLQAWGQAPQALRFYSKEGFEVYGTAVFAFGERADGDLILARRLTTVMQKTRASPMIAIKSVSTVQELAAARDLIRAHVEAHSDAHSQEATSALLAALPEPYVAPAGGLWLAWEGTEAAGCIALRSLAPGIGEIKRMYVRPASRGRGIARALAERAIVEARARGYERLRLGTLKTMYAAQNLYVSLGFRPIEPYRAVEFGDTMFYELEMGAPAV